MKNELIQMKLDKEFEKFYKTNLPKVVSHIYHRMSNNDTAKNIAEDLAQEVFYVALAKWDDLKVNETPLRWLFQTANYKIMEWNRRQASHPMVYLEDNPLESTAEEENYGMSELELSALSAVNEGEWDLLKKYYLQGYSIEELAEAEGITPNNMRVRLMRMRGKLKAELKSREKLRGTNDAGK